jgi:hypothetical protein
MAHAVGVQIMNSKSRIENHEAMLRSVNNLVGFTLGATDGEIGHLEDIILSDNDWVIRYLVVDTRNWLVGQSVLIPPEWVKDINWDTQEVWVDAPQKTIEGCPPYDPAAPVNRAYETQMYDYYGRPKYWA